MLLGCSGPGTSDDPISGDTEGTSADTTVGTSSEGTTDASSDGSTGTKGETGSSGSVDDSESGTTGAVDPAWQDFLDARESMLEALAVPIMDCVDNHDTNHPAFHGCIDWHSAVHATYALHLIYRATGDQAYLEAAQAHLTPAQLDAELEDVQAGQLPQELPYGYAWFLTLAIERDRATGRTDLQPLADEIATRLRVWLAGRTPNQIFAGVLADDYGNLSWAVLNLWRWGGWTGDAALQAEMETFVADVLLDPVYDEMCPLTQDTVDIDDFFPPCLHRAMAIVEIADPSVVQAWVRDNVPSDLQLVPLQAARIENAHQGGLNFARAWGLWNLWLAAGDPTWREQYVDHVVTHVEQPELWAENYQAFSHWVAQCGVYAIGRTYED